MRGKTYLSEIKDLEEKVSVVVLVVKSVGIKVDGVVLPGCAVVADVSNVTTILSIAIASSGALPEKPVKASFWKSKCITIKVFQK